MEFRVLGPLEVDDGGRRVDMGGARPRRLLSILLLHRGEAVSADRLIEELYGAEPPPTAGKSLQAHVSRLRKSLGGDGHVQTLAGGYALRTEDDDVDVERFAALHVEGRGALSRGEPERAADLLGNALDLWRGRPFAELTYADFAQPELSRLDELRLACLEDRIDAELALGRHVALAGELERLVAEQPLRERLRGQQMLALYRSGRQADALEAYQDVRRVLVDELGIEPGRALQELEHAILNQDPQLEPIGAPSTVPTDADPPNSLAAGAFVGRDKENAALASALADARSGRGRLVLLSGEAGIGKSRLADELAARAKRSDVRILWGRCWEAGGAPAYWPWVQALRTYLRDADAETIRMQLGRGAADVAQLLPELRELFPDLAEPPSLDSEGARFRLFDATVTFLRRVAAERPLLVVLDDVHAADAPSLLLLEFVAAELVDTRIMVLAAYREPELEPGDPAAVALASVARHASTRIALGGLHQAEVASFIELTSDVEPPPSLVTAIAAETEGNPLFVGEIVRLLDAEGRLGEPADPSWRVTIPETVKEVIGRRLRRLTPECTEMLAAASVVGREFGLELVERLSGQRRTELLELLGEATAARVVTDVPGSLGRIRFSHALVRDTLYDALPHGRRLELHRRTGEAIEELAGTDVTPFLSELAHHFFRALPAIEADMAVGHCQRAGDRAAGQLAHEEAARLYEAALQALTLRSSADPDLERVLLLSLGESLARSGEMPTARDAFLRAAALARATDAPQDLAAAALGYSGRVVWARAGGDRLIVPLLQEALAAVGDEATPLRARLLARLAGALRDEPDPTRRLAIGDLAVETARATGDLTALAYALAGLCGAQHGQRDEATRLAVAEELATVARRIGDKESECEALVAETLVRFDRGDMHAVRAITDTLSALANELRQPSHQWFATTGHALIALHEGQFERAERLAEESFELGRRAHPDAAESAHAIQLYEVRRQQGRSAEVYELISGMARDYPARPLYRCALARLSLELGRSSEARQLFEELASNDFTVVPRDNEWLLAANYLTDVCRGLRDDVRARVLYDLLLPSADKIVNDVAEGCAGSVERVLGMLASMVGRKEEAIAHLHAAIAVNIAIGTAPWIAYARVELAELLRGTADDAEAAALLEEARSTADELGMVPLGERIALLTAHAR